MNPRNTWRWMVVAAGLFAFIVFYQRHVDKSGGGPVRVLPNLKAAAATSVQVRFAGRMEEIRADRTNGTWQLSRPLVYPAQAASIENLLTELERLTPATYITARELRDRPKAEEEYGFATPQVSIIIEQLGYTARLQVGAKTSPGDQMFLQVVGGEGVYVVDTDLLKYIPRSADDWRDTALLDLKGLAFDRLAVTNGAKVFELRRDATNQLWRMVFPLQARANNAKIEESLQLIQSVRVRQFVPDDSRADLETFGLQPPELELTLGQGTNMIAQLQFGKGLTNDTRLVYARRVGLNATVAVPKDLLTPWYALVNDFRDPLLITLTAPVASIEVHGQDNFSVQQQTNDMWRFLPQDLPADAGLVKDLLSALTAMQIVEFTKDVATAPDLPLYGLASPTRRYTLRSPATNSTSGPTNAIIAELSFGTNQADKVFVQRTDELGFVYAVKLADFQRLPAAGWQMRERRIWNLATNDIAHVTIRQQGRVRQIVRNGPHDWSLAPGSQGVIELLAVDATVNELCRLTATAWVGRGAADRARFGFNDNSHQITLELKNGEKASVEISSGAPAGVPCAAVTLDGEPWVFECPAWLYEYVQRYLSVPPSP
jgi:Domain of unknown function (DUF4340)